MSGSVAGERSAGALRRRFVRQDQVHGEFTTPRSSATMSLATMPRMPRRGRAVAGHRVQEDARRGREHRIAASQRATRR